RLSQIDSAIEKATEKGRTTAAMKLAEDQRKARAGLVDERKREAGNSCRPTGGTCHGGCQGQGGGIGGGAHPIRCRRLRYRRSGDGDSVADSHDGLVLRPARHCADGRGFSTQTLTPACCPVLRWRDSGAESPEKGRLTCRYASACGPTRKVRPGRHGSLTMS